MARGPGRPRPSLPLGAAAAAAAALAAAPGWRLPLAGPGAPAAGCACGGAPGRALASGRPPLPRRAPGRPAGPAARRCAAPAEGGGPAAASGWSVRELRRFLGSHGVRHDDCFEKAELVARAEEVQRSGARQPQPTPAPAPAPAADFSGFGELVTVPSAAEEGCSLVFFHGFGDSARGFVGQLPSLLGVPSARYVLPTARLQGGMRSWFASMGPGGAEESVRYAHHLLRQELQRGVPADRLFVGGFSQGGSVAVRAALSFPDAALGGCVAASTFLGLPGRGPPAGRGGQPAAPGAVLPRAGGRGRASALG
ncbi:unnamed protein product [Prorocentrum cordatum]|uniref:Phospholipase/carboxylesterase/thioesterase domain-containing protein n=1 Tax=Prorocentrum cordatum TaxID=2364126 RepID=A0ABN9UE62_9DINO|nr:unnamed protein product [Polarella glacialis]